jgi:hypothetical protein
MRSLVKPIGSLAVAFGFAVLPSFAAFAQHPQIMVPTPPGGPGQTQQSIAGCYAINQSLYGPYHMDFCLDRWGGGSYQVTGALYCNGRADWRQQWNGEVQIDIHRSNCGRGVDWSADRMVCRMSAPQWPPHQPGPWIGPQPHVAVPTPRQQILNCTYYPGIRGYQPIFVTAAKQDW